MRNYLLSFYDRCLEGKRLRLHYRTVKKTSVHQILNTYITIFILQKTKQAKIDNEILLSFKIQSKQIHKIYSKYILHTQLITYYYTRCLYQIFLLRKKCKAQRYAPFESTGYEVSKMVKTKKIHRGIFVPSSNLYLSNSTINSWIGQVGSQM